MEIYLKKLSTPFDAKLPINLISLKVHSGSLNVYLFFKASGRWLRSSVLLTNAGRFQCVSTCFARSLNEINAGLLAALT